MTILNRLYGLIRRVTRLETAVQFIPDVDEYIGTIAAGAATPTIATVAIAASTNVAVEADIVAHAYGGRKSSGCLQWRGSRDGSAALVEDGQSMVGVWDTSPADNTWDPRFEVVGNSALLKITSDPSVQITYRCRVSSEAIDTSADPEPSWVALRAVAVAACAAAGGWAIDAEHYTDDPTKPGYASVALDFVGTRTFTRPVDNTWDPQVTTTSEGYACFRPAGYQGFLIAETLTYDGTTGCRLVYVIKPDSSVAANSTLFDDGGSSILTGTKRADIVSTGPYIVGLGAGNVLVAPDYDLQLLEYRFDRPTAKKRIYRDNALLGEEYWNRSWSIVNPHIFYAATGGAYTLGCHDDVLEMWYFPRVVEGDMTALLAYVRARYAELAGIPA